MSERLVERSSDRAPSSGTRDGAPASAAIVTEALGKRYGSTWALQDVDLSIPAGSVCALVGSNGAGKTTLLRLLAGVSTATRGSACVAGQRPADDVEFLGRIAYVAQDVPLYRRWTVADHLRLGRELNERWDHDVARDRLDALGIPQGRKIGALSGGMRAQVALALALGKQPDVLILDEPLAALDPLARREFMATVVAAVAVRPLTVLLSSHLLPDLERICDHLVVLAAGRLVLAGAIDDVLRDHKRLTAAARATTVLERDHMIVDVARTPRQVSAVVRLSGPLLEPGWDVADMSLEDIVLAYLGQRDVTAPPATGALSLVEDRR